jgi:predicted RNA-binding Zn ribbon-like protein
LIGQRNLLAARVRLHIQRGNLAGANRVMSQLRELRNFTEMNDQLSRLQRSILEQTTASTTRSSQTAIDRMFKATREMLQKYLQDETVAETARLLRDATERIDRTEEFSEGEA